MMELTPYPNYFWQTNLIRLRPLRPDDAEKKRHEWMDTEARRLLESQLDLPPVSLETFQSNLLGACDFKGDPDTRSFAIETLDGEFVGWVNLFLGEPRHGRFSLGVSIFREYQRNGYALDAANLILQYGFNELRCHKCNSTCLDINSASIAYHKKLGFVEEGRRREVCYMNGHYHDEVLFGMTFDEFNRARSG
jgi:RimJ/RimL family protein N-acetyltransferase